MALYTEGAAGGDLQTNRRLPLSDKQRRKSEISGVEIFNISFSYFYPGDHDKYFVGCISATNHRAGRHLIEVIFQLS